MMLYFCFGHYDTDLILSISTTLLSSTLPQRPHHQCHLYSRGGWSLRHGCLHLQAIERNVSRCYRDLHQYPVHRLRRMEQQWHRCRSYWFRRHVYKGFPYLLLRRGSCHRISLYRNEQMYLRKRNGAHLLRNPLRPGQDCSVQYRCL